MSNYKKLTCITILALSLMAIPSHAQYCDGFPYMTINSATSADVMRVRTFPEVDLEFVCNTGLEINAIGINSVTGELLAWDDPADRLVSVDSACNVSTVALTGSFDPTPRFLLGDVSQDGSMYVAWRRNLPRLLVVDLTTQIASEVMIQGNPRMSDWAFGPDDLLYGLNADSGIITTIDPTNGAVIPTSVPAPTVLGGAVWFDQNDDFWIYSQSTGDLNQIRIGSGTGEIVTIGTGVTASGADGAACATSLVTQGPTPTPVPANSKSTFIVLIMLLLGVSILQFNFRKQ